MSNNTIDTHRRIVADALDLYRRLITIGSAS